VMLNAMGAAPTPGLSFVGDKKRLEDLLLVIEEDQYREDGVSASNTKENRELKNLECSINFEALGSGSS
jgi:hypothetical protein